MRLLAIVTLGAILTVGASADLYSYESVWVSEDREFRDVYVVDHPVLVDSVYWRVDTLAGGRIIQTLDTMQVELAPSTPADRNRLMQSQPLMVVRTTIYYEVWPGVRRPRITVRSVRSEPGIDALSRVFARQDCEPGDSVLIAGAYAGKRICRRAAPDLPAVTWQTVADLLGDVYPLTEPVDLTVPPGEDVRP